MDFRIFPLSSNITLWALIATIYAFSLNTCADVIADINTLEKQLHEVSVDAYSVLALEVSECQHRAQSLKELNKLLDQYRNQKKQVIGVCVIQNNVSLIKNNIDSKEIFSIFDYLLENDHLKLANTLFTVAKRDGDKSLVSNIAFIYAKYYEQRKDWSKVIQLVANNYNDLSFEDANYARLMVGTALQRTKSHRKAVDLYLKIPEKSVYYAVARLNIATAYLRQDWWTDAHIKINELINNKKIKIPAEMVNRLYLVLGYSLLQKEYYRDSREAFRNVEINSQYSNKALLGIALTATNQEDFISALNAINILKNKSGFDLVVDESYLLLPYIHEKLKQNLAASASYTAAQDYYKKRISDINMIIEKRSISSDISEFIKNDNLTIDNNYINYSEDYPESFLKNYSTIKDLLHFIQNTNNTKIKNIIRTLNKKYDDLGEKIINSLLSKRLLRLNNYMNQSRYGMARLIDSSNTEKQ